MYVHVCQEACVVMNSLNFHHIKTLLKEPVRSLPDTYQVSQPAGLLKTCCLNLCVFSLPQIVVDHSDTKPVLILSDLVNGTYNFVLTVTNKNREHSKDNVTLMVLANPLDPYMLQVHLEEDASNFSKADLVCGVYYVLSW